MFNCIHRLHRLGTRQVRSWSFRLPFPCSRLEERTRTRPSLINVFHLFAYANVVSKAQHVTSEAVVAMRSTYTPHVRHEPQNLHLTDSARHSRQSTRSRVRDSQVSTNNILCFQDNLRTRHAVLYINTYTPLRRFVCTAQLGK